MRNNPGAYYGCMAGNSVRTHEMAKKKTVADVVAGLQDGPYIGYDRVTIPEPPGGVLTPELTLQQPIDNWGAARIARLAQQKVVDALEVEEKKLKAKVIQAMIDAKQTSTGGQRYGANYSRKEKPTAGDWSKIYKWIAENDAFDLLQKRLTEKAVEARWEDGIEIPGVVKFPVDDVTMFTV